MSNSTIADAWILQSGETLWVRPIRPDGSSALGGIVTDIADGCTITRNGVTSALTDPIRSQGMEGFFFPLLPARITGAVDDNDPACSSTGTWAEHTPSAGVGGHFTGWDANNSQYRTAAAPTATWTWPPVTGLVPGRYRLSDHVGGLTDPAHTTQARYTVRDGSGTVLGTFDRDLKTQLFPHFDGIVSGLEAQHLGYFTLGPGQTSVTVTLSNAAGSGSLVADSVMLESAWEPFAVPGDTVTAHFPAGAVTVWGVPTDEATVAVEFKTDEDFCYPIAAPADRVMKAGVNVDGIRADWFPAYLADRSPGCDCWQGDALTLDEHYEMVANGGTAYRTMLYYVAGDGGLSPRGMYAMDEGVVRCEFNASGVAFDATARANTGIQVFGGFGAPVPSTPVLGAKTFTDLGSGRWRLEQRVDRPAWSPISGRSADFSYFWTQGIRFVTTQPGLLITDWKWFDPRVPVGYTGTAHPDEVARIGGKGLAIRSMNWLSTNFSKAKNVGDFIAETEGMAGPGGGAPTPNGEHEYVIWRGNLVSVRPADLSGADTDDVAKHFPTNGFNGFFVATFDAPVDAYPDGNNFLIRATGSINFPATIGGQLQTGLMWGAFKIPGKPNELVVVSAISSPIYDISSGQRATLDGTYTLTAGTGSVFKNNLLPYETFLKYCSDVGGEPWINVPHLATDAFIDWMADQAIAHTPADRPVHVEYSNETWNAAWLQFQYFSYACQYANYLHSVDPVTYPYSYASATRWIAHQAGHIFKRFRARWAAAGRDPALVVREMGSLTQNYGVTEEIMAQCAIEGTANIDFDHISLDAYQDKDPPGFNLQFATSEAQTSARLSPEGKLDVLQGATYHGIRHLWLEGHLQRVRAVAGYEDKFASAYECGWSYIAMDRDGPRGSHDTYEMMASPRMFRMTAAKQSFFESIGYRVACKYVMAYYGVPGGDVAWSDLYSNRSALGTGAPSENANPYDWPASSAETLGGRVAWASGFDFAAAIVEVATAPLATATVSLAATSPAGSAAGVARKALAASSVLVGASSPAGRAAGHATSALAASLVVVGASGLGTSGVVVVPVDDRPPSRRRFNPQRRAQLIKNFSLPRRSE